MRIALLLLGGAATVAGCLLVDWFISVLGFILVAVSIVLLTCWHLDNLRRMDQRSRSVRSRLALIEARIARSDRWRQTGRDASEEMRSILATRVPQAASENDHSVDRASLARGLRAAFAVYFAAFPDVDHVNMFASTSSTPATFYPEFTESGRLDMEEALSMHVAAADALNAFDGLRRSDLDALFQGARYARIERSGISPTLS